MFAAVAQDGGAAVSNAGLIDLGGHVVVFDTLRRVLPALVACSWPGIISLISQGSPPARWLTQGGSTNSMRTISILVLVLLVAGFGFMVYQTFLGPDRVPLAGRSLPEVLGSGDLWEFIAITFTLILFGGLELVDLRKSPPAGIENAAAAHATVLQVWDTGTTINDDPQVGLLLQVAPADGSTPFEAKATALVPRLSVAQVRPGIAADVEYDPLKPQRLRILSLHVEDVIAGDAAARLRQLDALRAEGLITAEEYRQKKEEILGTR